MKTLVKILLFIFSPLVIAGEAPEFINQCFDCHGPKGISGHSEVPTIAGASAYFIESSLFAYKDDVRPVIKSKFFYGDTARAETDMKAIVNKLNDEQITKAAAYFAEQTFVSAKQSFNKKLAAAGKKVHSIRCEKCHGDGGTSVDDDSGILAGQWTPYLKLSMEHFKTGTREMDKKMKKKVDKLSKVQWQALLAYYASQQ
ncbi:MAG: c-type cytochrome [Methylococcales bacterium]